MWEAGPSVMGEDWQSPSSSDHRHVESFLVLPFKDSLIVLICSPSRLPPSQAAKELGELLFADHFPNTFDPCTCIILLVSHFQDEGIEASGGQIIFLEQNGNLSCF